MLAWTGSPAVLAAVVAGVVAALWLALRPGPVDRRRLPELGALALAGLGLAWIAARPVWVQSGERTEEGRFVVLVDASRSMGVSEPGGGDRLGQARALLAKFPGAEVFHFGGELVPGEPAQARLGTTDIGGALAALSRRYAGEKLAGIALLSDGLDRGGLLVESPDGSRSVAAGALPDLPGPLTVYQVGRDRDVPDLAVSAMRAGSFAFLRAPFSVDVDVRASGIAAESAVVTLTRNGQPAGSKAVKLDGNGAGTAHFTVTPDMAGRFVYEATVPTPEGDAVPANNGLSRAIRVVRDRVRVLQVCGSPSMDQKFLRLFLKEDPGVDLVSFFILRTLEDFGAGYRSDEISLIEFPYRRLFSDELGTFDLVILQNFDYAPYFENDADRLLENIARFVREGGALAMLGGDRSFDLGRYAGTPLESVLPVRLGVQGDGADPTPFRPELTEAGGRHPVTRILPDATENAAAWAQLASMDGANLTLGPADGAAVLLAHPAQRVGGAAAPVLAVRQVGLGRTMALTVDSSWRWSFSEAGHGGGNQAYLRFWKNAMRWLVGDSDEQAVTVEAAKENVEPGEPLRATARVRDAGFGPLAGVTVTGTVSGAEGEVSVKGVSGADGTLSFDLPTAERGAHRIKIDARASDGARLGVAETVYAVVTRDPELDRIAPDGALLAALADSTGGRFVAPGSWVDPLMDASAGRVVRDRRETPLWAAPLGPLLVGFAASASWWLRRQAGRR
jgi:uncharacterized membrane protein